MSANTEFLLGRAAMERDLADAAKLTNVKESHLRAAAAWDRLAQRSQTSDRLRAEEEKRKAETSALAK